MNSIDPSMVNLLLVFVLTFFGGALQERWNLFVMKRGLATSIFLLICIVLGTTFTYHGWKPSQLADMHAAVSNISIAWLPLLGYSGALLYTHLKRRPQFSTGLKITVITLSMGVFILGALLLPKITYTIGGIPTWSLQFGLEGAIIPFFIIIVAVVEKYRLPLFSITTGILGLIGVCLLLSGAFGDRSSLEASHIPQVFQLLLCILGIFLQTIFYSVVSKVFCKETSNESVFRLFLWLCCLVVTCVILAGILVIGALFLL